MTNALNSGILVGLMTNIPSIAGTGDKPITDLTGVRFGRLMVVGHRKERRACGSKVKSASHHIQMFSREHALRNDLTNLITLCKKCHDKAHPRGTKSVCLEFQALCLDLMQESA